MGDSLSYLDNLLSLHINILAELAEASTKI